MSVSVAMAVYNGERYLREQLDSVLEQLGPQDELVASLDPSTDGSESILLEYQSRDNRVQKIDGPGRGLMANFENALFQCKNQIIFLADQDDVWEPDKVQKCLKCFEKPEVMAVVHDAAVYDGRLEAVLCDSFFRYKNCGSGIVKNILKNSYMGCCMAFRRELLQWALPFPENIPMHDQWLGLLAELHGKTIFLPERLLCYRRHEQNMTEMHHAGFFQMIRWRMQISWQLLRSFRKDKNKFNCILK